MLPLCPALGVQAGLVWGKGTVELREGRSLGRLPGGGAVIAGLWRQVSRERAGAGRGLAGGRGGRKRPADTRAPRGRGVWPIALSRGDRNSDGPRVQLCFFVLKSMLFF